MAGYSGTPLAQKLGIKAGARLALIEAPEDFLETLGELPGEVTLRDDGPADVMVCFGNDPTTLERKFPAWKARLDWSGGLWVAWPKRRPRGPVPLLSENVVREIGLAAGLVDNKVCAIDDEWSGLRFVWRVADRPAKPGGEKA
jgi:hypothetical protein